MVRYEMTYVESSTQSRSDMLRATKDVWKHVQTHHDRCCVALGHISIEKCLEEQVPSLSPGISTNSWQTYTNHGKSVHPNEGTRTAHEWASAKKPSPVDQTSAVSEPAPNDCGPHVPRPAACEWSGSRRKSLELLPWSASRCVPTLSESWADANRNKMKQGQRISVRTQVCRVYDVSLFDLVLLGSCATITRKNIDISRFIKVLTCSKSKIF